MALPKALEHLIARYPVMAELPPEQLSSDLARLPWMTVPAGTVLFDEGEPCRGFPFVIEGEVRVTRGSADGRELSLYHVAPGEICVVSSGCLFGSRAMSARGSTITDSTLLVASAEQIQAWCDNRSIRDFLFGMLADRLADLMELVEAVAFQRLDQRLAHALLGHGGTLHCSHQQLADELGTAREMVSRLLKRFETDGLVGLGRERIQILDAAALRRLAEPM